MKKYLLWRENNTWIACHELCTGPQAPTKLLRKISPPGFYNCDIGKDVSSDLNVRLDYKLISIRWGGGQWSPGHGPGVKDWLAINPTSKWSPDIQGNSRGRGAEICRVPVVNYPLPYRGYTKKWILWKTNPALVLTLRVHIWINNVY